MAFPPDPVQPGPPTQLGDLWFSFAGVEALGVVDGTAYAQEFLARSRALGAHDDEVMQFLDDMKQDEGALTVFYHGLREGLYGLLLAPEKTED